MIVIKVLKRISSEHVNPMNVDTPNTHGTPLDLQSFSQEYVDPHRFEAKFGFHNHPDLQVL